ncbi:MAG: hypothetical protein IKY79_07270 [Bacteroidales bacterium]|nr:hypothetical protein [Bacteroidales bacterium]
MKNILNKLSLLMVAMTLVFAGCEDDFGPEHDRGNNGEGGGGGATTGTINGHDYVDLGLPSGLKWATCNVGANTPEEYGNYYAWGETTTKSSYTDDNSLTYGRNMGDISGNVNYDAATANWGNSWRMPTKAEMEELRDNCTWTWITQGNVNGMKVTGPNGNSIFLPAAGIIEGTSYYDIGEFPCYWGSTPYEGNNDYAYVLCYENDCYVSRISRVAGFPVRPVSGTINYGTEELPTVTTNSVISITNSAQCGGNVTSDGGATVTQRGVCWSTYQNPTIYDYTTYDGEGTGVFTSYITNLLPGTTYYVRAYATNSEGTAYGNQISFTTQSSGTNPGITVNFGGNSWTATNFLGYYYNSYGAIGFDAYEVSGSFPVVMGAFDASGTGTYSDAIGSDLGYSNGIILYLEYWETKSWTINNANYGDWWAKNATINITELDLTAMSVSMNINATMFEFGDIVVWNEEGTSGTITPELLPNATTRSMSVSVTDLWLSNADKSVFGKRNLNAKEIVKGERVYKR